MFERKNCTSHKNDDSNNLALLNTAYFGLNHYQMVRITITILYWLSSKSITNSASQIPIKHSSSKQLNNLYQKLDKAL
ncbi:hypothetical protein AQUCO_38800001v1 [Aquilegia coerulea]|uniref:Uncharacterized protein n=1 Tax=Aquilegia coerulea TaxID=218851 RepID=A0A2G5C0F7_AQUCA|nr:hypothetical protein AQUCO_38800001v1 [Aquilegia coerulea]